ncbi:protein DPCD-like isoform X2 [Coccinella septempunctata]|nr:protein DPCD-like isoform X2 [Coccinella septempunctata]XP_044761539.1 protein DPCD-like isoform X2 [Coccinella septempunctata]XP_044761540.1 protein DPCD-like isoform X2 [Coccinella septempunctata]
MKNWLDQLKNAKKIVSDYESIRTVLYEFKDGRQLEEEYNLQLNVVSRRAWKLKDQLNKEWNVELGEPPVVNEDFTTIPIKENSSQPYIRKRNTRRIIEWRIRNLPYPSETYIVTCNEEDKSVTVRTTNKKYYKTLKIPELERLGLSPEQSNLSFKYDKVALVIKYIKPIELIEFDKAVIEMVKELKPTTNWFDPEINDSEEQDEPILKKRKIIEL